MTRRASRVMIRVSVVVVVTLATLAITLPLGAVGPPPWAPPYQEPDPDAAALDLLGTWGLDIVDADGLCVSIVVPEWFQDRDVVGQEIAGAFEDWVDAVNSTGPILDLPWTEDTNGDWDGSNQLCAGGDVGPVDVSIEVRRGGGLVQGTTQLTTNDDGFIVFARIQIKGKFVGPGANSAEQIGLIARHEIGHGLGLGHWNIQGQLMSPVLVADTTTQPNECELEALRTALAWFFDGDLDPTHFAAEDDPHECTPA